MRREFTLREKILIGILAFVIIGVCYYYFFLSPLNDRVASYKSGTESLQSEIMNNSGRYIEMKTMEAEVESYKEKGAKTLPAYDNSNNLIIELHEILGEAVDYTLKFGNVAQDDFLVSRPAYLTITTKTYNEARAIIDKLYESNNVMVMGDLNISIENTKSTVSSNGTATISKQDYIRVTMNVTYFEADIQN